MSPLPLLGVQLPLVSALPFVALLAAIAVAPLVAPAWWHSNRHKAIVAGLLSLPILWQFGTALGAPGRAVLGEKLGEYAAFIIVIAALFVIAGGIHIQGSLAGTPLVNTGMLGLGAVLANLLGTTGAAVLLIRPLLRAHKSRRRKSHIVIFFIFLVANCGGLLTPIGDPPLLLGYLNGVPFAWTLRLWPQWLAINGILLVLFNFWDQWALDKDEKELPGSQHDDVCINEPLPIRGDVEMLVLLAVIATIVTAGRAAAAGHPWRQNTREVVIVGLALVGYVAGAQERRTQNGFSFGPLIEGARLFAG